MKYDQVFIKSEEDLPKDDKAYWCHNIKQNRLIHVMPKWKRDEIDWYLRSIPEITDEDIEAWAEGESLFYTSDSRVSEKEIKHDWDKRKNLIKAAKAMRDGEIKHKTE